MKTCGGHRHQLLQMATLQGRNELEGIGIRRWFIYLNKTAETLVLHLFASFEDGLLYHLVKIYVHHF
jgi:hypothetical protein